MAGLPWVALSYRLPREPSRLRLAVWRRLKRLGATVLHDAIWLLPADAKTREAFEWLAEEIEEQGGTVLIWEATSFDAAQDDALVAQFRAQADERYAAIAESAEALRRLAGLERALRLESRRDHFRAPGRREAEQALHAAAQALGVADGSRPAEWTGRGTRRMLRVTRPSSASWASFSSPFPAKNSVPADAAGAAYPQADGRLNVRRRS